MAIRDTIKVLCAVEDDPHMRFLIRSVLSLDDRIEVRGDAEDLEGAIVAVRNEQPDLIVLDHFIRGTVMGLQAAPLLKAEAPAALVLLFTSHDLAVEVGREPAIDGYLRKGDIGQLLPTVRQMLGLVSAA